MIDHNVDRRVGALIGIVLQRAVPLGRTAGAARVGALLDRSRSWLRKCLTRRPRRVLGRPGRWRGLLPHFRHGRPAGRVSLFPLEFRARLPSFAADRPKAFRHADRLLLLCPTWQSASRSAESQPDGEPDQPSTRPRRAVCSDPVHSTATTLRGGFEEEMKSGGYVADGPQSTQGRLSAVSSWRRWFTQGNHAPQTAYLGRRVTAARLSNGFQDELDSPQRAVSRHVPSQTTAGERLGYARIC
jgi:hypothetical protein